MPLARPLFLCALVSLAAPALAQRDWSGGLVVFGDSLSDTGNTLSLVGRPDHNFYSRGRWTNDNINTAIPALNMQTSGYAGVWHEQTARLLGLPVATPSRAGGTNRAYGGATSAEGINTVRIFGVDVEIGRNMRTQVADFVTANQAGIPSDRLYITWAGGNDVRDAARAANPTPAAVRAAGVTAAENVALGITQLAQHLRPNERVTLLWPNIPPMGAIPDAQSWAADIRTAAGQASTDFNTRQDQLITALANDYPAVTIRKLDIQALFADIIAGRTDWRPNTTQNIIAAGDFAGAIFNPQRNPAVAGRINPDNFLFWDQVHPTSRAHLAIGIAAYFAVPAPGMLAAAPGLLFALRRRR